MKIDRRQALRIVPLLTLASVAILGAASPPAKPGSVAELEQAAIWVADHRERLPAALGELALMPKLYRKAVFNALSPEEKIAVRREHLQSFVLPEAALSATQKRTLESIGAVRLTDYQKSVVQGAIDSLSILYDSPLDQVEKEALANRLCTRGKAIFPPAVASAIFVQIGPVPDKSTQDFASRWRKTSQDSPGLAVAAASIFGGLEVMLATGIGRLAAGSSSRAFSVCNCNPCSWCDCPSGVDCPNAGGGCTLPDPVHNCGCFDIFPCAAWCNPNQQ
jgi:hypothetical protein